MYALAAFLVTFHDDANSRTGLDHQTMLGMKTVEAGSDLVGNKKRQKKKVKQGKSQEIPA